jgi:hypothetical protein
MCHGRVAINFVVDIASSFLFEGNYRSQIYVDESMVRLGDQGVAIVRRRVHRDDP